MNFINIFYGNEDIEIEESYVKYDTNFEKKSIDFNYKTIDINDREAKSYIESNSYTKKYLDYLSKNTGEILVDTDNNNLIGYVFIGKSKDKGFISTLEIVKEYRGYGFGKELLKDAINKYDAIDLVVYKDNKVALDMYKKFGFVIIGEDKNGKAWYMKNRSKLSKNDKIIQESYILETKDITLYHGSINGDYKKILANSPNNGKRYEKISQSSFWFKKKEYAIMFATAELIKEESNPKISILIDNDMKTLVPEKYKEQVENIIKNKKSYVYSKTVDSKDVSGGQGRNFPEYTLNFDVTPDDAYTNSYNDMKKSIKYVTDEYIKDTIEKYKRNKMTYGNNIFGQIKDFILYDDNDTIIKTKKKIKNYNESYTLEAGKDITSKIILERLYPRVKDVLSTPQGDRKFKIMVGSYMDRNQDKLYEVGPNHLIPFTDQQKNEYFDLFNVDKKEIMEMTKEILKQLGSSSDFKYLNNNPIFFLFYCCIRYYYITKNDKGLNTALAIYALSVYPSVWSVYFKYPPNPGVMQYTVDHLTEKYILKQAGNIFNALFTSINRTFTTYSTKDTERGFISIVEASDKEVIRFIQRIHNDQKSMIRNIVDMYMINHRKGLRISDNLESQDSITIDPDKENNSSVVDSVTNKVLIPIISNGVNLKIVTQSKDLAQISLVECRYYISKILIDKYTDDIRRMIQAILFRFLYDDKNRREDINSSKYLVWCSQLFRQTNSKNENVKIIKDTLDKWSEETGIHAKYKREATRVNYKKAIFFYFCISIQYYNQ